VNRKFNFQHTIVAVQIRRFSHNATRQGARASVRRAARMEGQKRLTQTQTRERDYEQILEHRVQRLVARLGAGWDIYSSQGNRDAVTGR
jgi:hypothetical protein